MNFLTIWIKTGFYKKTGTRSKVKLIMDNPIYIAVDAMGGENSPENYQRY